jgi:hypothetical protein
MIGSQMRKLMPLCILVFAASGLAGPTSRSELAKPDGDKLIVHEWGTYLSVQGSDGVTLGGMIDSEEKLPLFVHEEALAGRNRACLFCKVETPVTYFYVDRPRTVEVRAAMPEGKLTHWYPAVRDFGPLTPTCKAPARDSYINWGKVELFPDVRDKAAGFSLLIPGFRPVARDDTWRFVRDTDSAFVKMDRTNPKLKSRPQGQVEKFLFYRGLGTFELPLKVEYREDSVHQLQLTNRGPDTLQGIFAVEVKGNSIGFKKINDLGAELSSTEYFRTSLVNSQPLQEGVPVVKQEVAAALVQAGLYPKEARAMVNNWEHSYFRTEGFRILYILPRSFADRTLPIEIKPAPQELVRVMVGRVEVLTPGTEQRIEKAVADLNSPDPAVQKSAATELARLGRLQEPALRRVVAMTSDDAVRAGAEALLSKK